MRKKRCPYFSILSVRTSGKSLGRSDVDRLAGSRGCAWATGGGEECGGSGDEGEFHDVSEFWFQ